MSDYNESKKELLDYLTVLEEKPKFNNLDYCRSLLFIIYNNMSILENSDEMINHKIVQILSQLKKIDTKKNENNYRDFLSLNLNRWE